MLQKGAPSKPVKKKLPRPVSFNVSKRGKTLEHGRNFFRTRYA